MERTYNGLYLSFDDFINNYNMNLQAWLNKNNNANELLFLQMLKNTYLYSGYIDEEHYSKEGRFRLVNELQLEKVNTEVKVKEFEKISINRLVLTLNRRIKRYIDFFCFDFSDNEIFELLKHYNSVIYNHYSYNDYLLEEYYPRLKHKAGVTFIPDERLEKIILGYINHNITRPNVEKLKIKASDISKFLPFLFVRDKKVIFNNNKYLNFLFCIIRCVSFIDNREVILKQQIKGVFGLLPHEINTVTTEPESIDFSEGTDTKTKLAILQELGIFDHLIKTAYPINNANKITSLLSAIIGGEAKTLQTYVNPIISPNTGQRNAPKKIHKEKAQQILQKLGYVAKKL